MYKFFLFLSTIGLDGDLLVVRNEWSILPLRCTSKFQLMIDSEVWTLWMMEDGFLAYWTSALQDSFFCWNFFAQFANCSLAGVPYHLMHVKLQSQECWSLLSLWCRGVCWCPHSVIKDDLLFTTIFHFSNELHPPTKLGHWLAELL